LKELVTVRLAADNSDAVFTSVDLGFRKPEPVVVAAPVEPAVAEVESESAESPVDQEDGEEAPEVATIGAVPVRTGGGRRRRRRGRGGPKQRDGGLGA
jgi:hypothetical protein